MKVDKHLDIKDYNYDLPDELIAQYPLEQRDQSRLLVYQNNLPEDSTFSSIADFLPKNSLLIFNNTRVIRARLIFSRETGSTIEIFCLEPSFPVTEFEQAFLQTDSCRWVCLVGNVKRWKSGRLTRRTENDGIVYKLHATLISRLDDGCFLVEFTWSPPQTVFSKILEYQGLIPLPPYIERASGELDQVRYQTILAEKEGSVAAPTAGLHFSESIFKTLNEKGIKIEKITLHVGLGTFRPVSADDISEHIMHSEKIEVSLSLIKQLSKKQNSPVIAVGTTSVRTLESLYWAGVKCYMGKDPYAGVDQWDPYENIPEISAREALTSLSAFLVKEKVTVYSCKTSLMIIPGYKFRLVDIMITNFHQPQSTLLLLVSAFIGDSWRDIYQYAIDNKFRFLSYGDVCLFFRK